MSIHHLDEGDLQALLDGELPQARASDALRHVGSCATCGDLYDRLREASATLSGALALLDDTRPAHWPALVPPSTTRRRSWGAIPIAKAATLLLFVGAAASATLPGSPLRAWLTGPSDEPATVAADARQGQSEEVAALSVQQPEEAGTAVAPDLGRFRIVLTRPQRGLTVRALLTDGPSGGAYIVGDSASAQFDGRTGSVEVIDAVGGELRIEIPRAATAASIEIDGEVYLVKEGDSLRLTGRGSPMTGRELEFRIE